MVKCKNVNNKYMYVVPVIRNNAVLQTNDGYKCVIFMIKSSKVQINTLILMNNNKKN